MLVKRVIYVLYAISQTVKSVKTMDFVIVINAIMDTIYHMIFPIVIKIVAVDFIQTLIYNNVCLAMFNVLLVIIFFLFQIRIIKTFFFY